jgi:ATP-dependent Zn protease
MRDIQDAFQEQWLGLENPIDELDPEQEWQIAVHEAGHAIAAIRLRGKDKRIVRVSIVRRGSALGYVLPVSKVDIYAQKLSDIEKDIIVSLAGHVATVEILGEAWTGATSDFRMARLRAMYLADLSAFGNYMVIDGKQPKVIENADNYLEKCMRYTQKLMQENREELVEVANALMEHKDLTGDEVIKIIEGIKNEKN